MRAFVPVALGLTTTALGTLLPILRDNDMLGGRFGRYLLAAGAVGELFPVFAIALFLGASNKFVALGSLLAVGVLALVLSFAPRLVRGNRLERILQEGEGSTAQTTVRWTVVLLLLLLLIAEEFGLDVVLGAFLAGIVLRRWAPGDVHDLEEQARRHRLRLLHPAVLRGLGDVPGHPLDRRGAAAAARLLRPAAGRSGGCRPCSCTATRCRRSGGSS